MSDPQGTGTGTNDAGEPQKNADGQTPEAKGDGTQPQGGAPAANTKDDKGAPASGDAAADYKFDAPEGVELDTKSVDAFKAIAKELKLPAEQASKIANIAIQAEAARVEAFKAQVQGWADTVSKDPELGKPEVQAAARQAIDTFGSPELKALLNSTGMGNHPELVRLMAKVGQAISEDKVRGTAGGDKPTPKSPADILYGTPTK